MSTGHSFWISDSFADEDADHENAFQILFGPTSYIKPLDFNPEELEMFEQNSKQAGSPKSNCVYPSPLESKTTVWREHGNHFQNILDFIEEMTEGNIRQRGKSCVKGLKETLHAKEVIPTVTSGQRTIQVPRFVVMTATSHYRFAVKASRKFLVLSGVLSTSMVLRVTVWGNRNATSWMEKLETMVIWCLQK